MSEPTGGSDESLKTLLAAALKFRDEREWKQCHNFKDLAVTLCLESAEVLECLAQIGVEYAQGIYIAVPESVEALNRITRAAPPLRLVHSA